METSLLKTYTFYQAQGNPEPVLGTVLGGLFASGSANNFPAQRSPTVDNMASLNYVKMVAGGEKKNRTYLDCLSRDK